jgi:hypothetical protein
MKKLFKIGVSIIALFLYSCSSSEDAVTVSDQLTDGTWKLAFRESYYYQEDVLDHIDTITTNTNLEKLTFETNLNVIYENPNFIDPIAGEWDLSNNDEYLSTTLHKNISIGGGGSTLTFYPHSKICEINQAKLVLQTDTITSTFISDGQITMVKQFEKYHYQH